VEVKRLRASVSKCTLQDREFISAIARESCLARIIRRLNEAMVVGKGWPSLCLGVPGVSPRRKKISILAVINRLAI